MRSQVQVYPLREVTPESQLKQAFYSILRCRRINNAREQEKSKVPPADTSEMDLQFDIQRGYLERETDFVQLLEYIQGLPLAQLFDIFLECTPWNHTADAGFFFLDYFSTAHLLRDSLPTCPRAAACGTALINRIDELRGVAFIDVFEETRSELTMQPIFNPGGEYFLNNMNKLHEVVEGLIPDRPESADENLKRARAIQDRLATHANYLLSNYRPYLPSFCEKVEGGIESPTPEELMAVLSIGGLIMVDVEEIKAYLDRLITELGSAVEIRNDEGAYLAESLRSRPYQEEAIYEFIVLLVSLKKAMGMINQDKLNAYIKTVTEPLKVKEPLVVSSQKTPKPEKQRNKTRMALYAVLAMIGLGGVCCGGITTVIGGIQVFASTTSHK